MYILQFFLTQSSSASTIIVGAISMIIKPPENRWAIHLSFVSVNYHSHTIHDVDPLFNNSMQTLNLLIKVLKFPLLPVGHSIMIWINRSTAVAPVAFRPK